MELSKIVNAYEALSKIQSTNNLPFLLAWQFSDVLESLDKHYKRYNEEREKIVKKYGEPNEDESYRIKPENLTKFQSDMNKLLLTKIDLKVDDVIQLEDLIDAKLVINKDVNLSFIRPFIKNKKAIDPDIEVKD